MIYSAEARGDEDSSNGQAYNYEKFKFRPHWGEKLIGRKRPTVYLMKWTEDDAKKQSDSVYQPVSDTNVYAIAPKLPEESVHISFGQAIFESDEVIIATGYEYTEDGRALGPVGCFNRPSGIWSIQLPQLPHVQSSTTEAQVDSSVLACVATRLSDKSRSCRSPRLRRDKAASGSSETTLIWLSHEVYGPHHSCAQLNVHGRGRILVRPVPVPVSKDSFPGLYIDQLPNDLSISFNMSPFIVTQSMWGSANHIVLISLSHGAIYRLTPEDMDGMRYSWTLLGTDSQQHILCARSSLNCPNQLLLGTIHSSPRYFVLWRLIDKPVVPQQGMISLILSIHPPS